MTDLYDKRESFEANSPFARARPIREASQTRLTRFAQFPLDDGASYVYITVHRRSTHVHTIIFLCLSVYIL